MKHTSSRHQGFVILFTILIAAIIMVIGLGIYSIATREAVLSGTAKEAQYAFYAADAGVECALFAQSLDSSQGGSKILEPGSVASFSCGDSLISIDSGGQGSSTAPYVIHVIVDRDKKTCAQVSIIDTLIGTTPARRIISQGYNICSLAEPLKSNPLLVERVLDTTYALTTGGGQNTPPVTPPAPSGGN
jgi:hypothetical protein